MRRSSSAYSAAPSRSLRLRRRDHDPVEVGERLVARAEPAVVEAVVLGAGSEREAEPGERAAVVDGDEGVHGERVQPGELVCVAAR